MSIWFQPVTPADLAGLHHGTLVEHLGIRITEIGEDFLAGTMPVDSRTQQPLGILHGGASVTLAETLGSVAATLCVDSRKFACVGQEINANHLRPASSGVVTGTARPIHIGKRSQVWQIEIRDERERLICISRLTLAVIERDERMRAYPLKAPT
jgi:1,4-dihydroxy-2-naphthoyl-CoA hydrolase